MVILEEVIRLELSFNDSVHLTITSQSALSRQALLQQAYQALLTELLWEHHNDTSAAHHQHQETMHWLLTELGEALKGRASLPLPEELSPLEAVRAAADYFLESSKGAKS
jgi:hypothetical protein